MSRQGQELLCLEPVVPTETDSLELSGDGPYCIGRERGSDLQLRDPMASRKHALIERREDEWVLTDQESGHGTFVNALRLDPDKPVPVTSGDLLLFGPCAFRLLPVEERERSYTGTGAPLASTTSVKIIPPDEPGRAAVERLELLIDCVAALDQCIDQRGLAGEALRVVLEGSGFSRAMVIREGDSIERLEVVAHLDKMALTHRPFEVSRTVIQRARSGSITQLTGLPRDLSESVTQLCIHSALCVPIPLDSEQVNYLYLDAREGEPPGHEDAVDFCAAIARLYAYKVIDLRRERTEKRLSELVQELRAARVVQQSLTPAGMTRTGAVRHASRIHPGRWVAGDFFDIFEISSGRTAFCFGDVCGQGMGAGILMSAVTAFTRASLSRDGDVASAADEVNRYVCERSEKATFVTILLGIFDPRHRELQFVDAGHGYWLLRREGEQLRSSRPSGSPPLGWFPDRRFKARKLRLEPGDRLIAFSDGLVDHRDPIGEPFEEERLRTAITPARTPEEDVKMAFDALRAFMGDNEFTDDTSIASLEVWASAP